MMALARELARDARMTMAVGTCTTYGGVPSLPPNPTGCKGLWDITDRTVINVPGCAPHPDDVFGTLLYYIRNGMPELDEYNRPRIFFPNLHDNCFLREYFDREEFAANFGEKKCYALLGCVGPTTQCGASVRGWNGGINWCVGCGSRCNGCTEPSFGRSAGGFYDIVDSEDL